MADAAASGRTPNFRSTSPSTDDARYVAGNRARQEAARARNASNPSFGSLLNRIIGGDPRARDRSTFRNPGPSQGIFGEPGLFSGGSKLGISDFIPFGGLINYMTRRPVDSGATYTMNTQIPTGDGVGGQQALANMQSRRLAANQRAEAAYGGTRPQAALAKIQDYGGYTPEPVETSILAPRPGQSNVDPMLELGQPSDPLYMPGGEFDAFMENVGSLPQFDEVRANPVKMRAAFEAYKKAVQAQGGAN